MSSCRYLNESNVQQLEPGGSFSMGAFHYLLPANSQELIWLSL